MNRTLATLLSLTVLTLVVAACSDVTPDQTFSITAPPEDQFPPLGDYLDHRCGSLDCHGQTSRNLRLYGREGLRLAPTDEPGAAPTTPAEMEADYRSVVGLEPEIMTAVTQDLGADPERLTFYRKPMGLESHKGGKLGSPGGVQDACIRSWLASAIDTAACQTALASP